MSELAEEEKDALWGMFISYCDIGSADNGWRSPELEKAIKKAIEILELEKGK